MSPRLPVDETPVITARTVVATNVREGTASVC
jgi:hypothetical protein